MWQDFANTLNELNKAYKALIELGKKKRNALVMVDMKTVENLLPQEEKLTAEIARLEKIGRTFCSKWLPQTKNWDQSRKWKIF